jgi:hypothetical protein
MAGYVAIRPTHTLLKTSSFSPLPPHPYPGGQGGKALHPSSHRGPLSPCRIRRATAAGVPGPRTCPSRRSQRHGGRTTDPRLMGLARPLHSSVRASRRRRFRLVPMRGWSRCVPLEEELERGVGVQAWRVVHGRLEGRRPSHGEEGSTGVAPRPRRSDARTAGWGWGGLWWSTYGRHEGAALGRVAMRAKLVTFGKADVS